MDTRIFAIRHGQTDWNSQGRAQGHSDQPLNAVGEGQAHANADVLAALLAKDGVPAPEVRVYASPLSRCRRTAEIVCGRLGCASFMADERLVEASFGEWEGLTDAEIKRRDPERRRARKTDRWNAAPPGGESYASLSARLLPFLDGLQRPAVLVTHLGVLRVMASLLTDRPEGEMVRFPFRCDAVYAFEKNGFAAFDQP